VLTCLNTIVLASAMANPEGAGISTKELFEWIQPSRIKAQKRVLILDACNSGQAINDIVKLGDANQAYTGARSDEQGKFIKAIDKLNERSACSFSPQPPVIRVPMKWGATTRGCWPMRC